jgi:hypothetical protein
MSPEEGRIRSTASGVPTRSASPSVTRWPLPGCTRANFTDELPEFSTKTRPESPGWLARSPVPVISAMLLAMART